MTFLGSAVTGTATMGVVCMEGIGGTCVDSAVLSKAAGLAGPEVDVEPRGILLT